MAWKFITWAASSISSFASNATFYVWEDSKARIQAIDHKPLPAKPPSHLRKHAYRPIYDWFHIRVLVLQPGDEGAPLVCSLREISLEEPPYYEALSYCWGTSKPSCKIICNGQLLSIGKNLFQALNQLRQPDRQRLLWIDAICINQDDEEERTHQVLLMRHIFKRCKHCLIWLGPNTFRDGPASELISRLSETFEYHDEETFSEDLHNILLPGRVNGTTPNQFKALGDLFRRPWFMRAWTLQEAVLPKNATFILGKYQWEAYILFRCARGLQFAHLEPLMGGDLGGFSQILKLAEMRLSHASPGTRENFLHMLRTIRHRDATDPRDKVYAALGLCGPDVSMAIQPRYNQPVQAVYTKVAKHLMKSYIQPLHVLLAASSVDCHKRQPGLPTWVPDWSQRIELHESIEFFEQNPNFRAGGIYPCTPSFFHPEAGGPERLYIQGKVVGTLETLLDRNSHRFRFRQIGVKICDFFWRSFNLIAQFFVLSTLYSCLKDQEEFENPARRTEPQSFVKAAWALVTNGADGRSISNWRLRDLDNHDTRRAWQTRFWDTMTLESSHRSAQMCMANPFRCELPYYAQDVGSDNKHPKAQEAFLQVLSTWTRVRQFCRTSGGQSGWVPLDAQVGDVVVVIKGLELPFVLRPVSGTVQEFIVVGHCYIFGLMYGEAMENEKIRLTDLVLR